MAKQQLQVDVEQEVYEVAKLAVDVVLALKAKKSPLQIITEEFKALEDAISGMSAIPADYAADKAGSLKAVLIPMCDLVDALTAKAAPAAPAA